jgi:thiamine pyrophosphate-dependent acetolactate synthase large subunit-like protein
MGDGDFLMGITALWTGAHYRIPGLIIVSNNSSYFIDEGHQERVALKRDRPVENKWIGQRMGDPQIDILGLANAQGVDGIRIESRADLNDLMAKAIKRVEAGEIIVVDVVVGDGSATHLN